MNEHPGEYEHLRALPDGSLTRAEVGILLDRIRDLATSRDWWAEERSEAISLDLAALRTENELLRAALQHRVLWAGSECRCDEGDDCPLDAADHFGSRGDALPCKVQRVDTTRDFLTDTVSYIAVCSTGDEFPGNTTGAALLAHERAHIGSSGGSDV